MDSRLQLSSKLGVGSTFYFDLDLQTTNEPEVETISDKEVVDHFAFQTDARLEALKMLVEDNKINIIAQTIIKMYFPRPLFMKSQMD
jgi:hypothetical protein